ncbi:uncharacterized protein IUM83_12870 [Phytophthora cinnamomi]|uniref:uncharacterized protein n=1 Tax=Phytophthora cinnamomi TaxID=4785 RepID=UPI003559D627|nr:hypothetical protein IUM83_12870 [Phytophthora cinnamomi]
MLNIPFEPYQRVPLIRPDTLEIMYVRRQHIVDCELMGRGNIPGAVFKDPQFTDSSTVKATRSGRTGKRRATNGIDFTFSDTDDEEKDEHTSMEQADIDMVRLHNRPLRKRARYTDDDFQNLLPPDGIDVPVLESRRDNAAFRPSQIERQVHNAVVHPSLVGKNAQAILESAQQSRNTKFLGTPPILRGAYDISFGVRGLSLMHFQRYFEQLEMEKATNAVNMTNFGRSNALQPATPPANVAEILDAFNTLLHFAKFFHNSTVYKFIKAGADFVETYAAFTRPDAATCNMLVL